MSGINVYYWYAIINLSIAKLSLADERYTRDFEHNSKVLRTSTTIQKRL